LALVIRACECLSKPAVTLRRWAGKIISGVSIVAWRNGASQLPDYEIAEANDISVASKATWGGVAAAKSHH